MNSLDAPLAESVVFREARDDDLRAILTLLADDPLGKHREIAPPENADIPSSYRAAFEAIMADPRIHAVVADVSGQIVGCFQLIVIPGLTYRGGLWATIESVRVAEGMRGRGVGKAMIRHAIERARECGCVMVQLTTDKRRIETHAFYRGLGFVASHEGMKMRL
jgi:GNAT superfamily N-acetyltransferase